MASSPRPSAPYLLIGFITLGPFWLLFRVRWAGVEHVPDEGGCVLAANHNSNLDPWVLALPVFPRRYLRFMAKSELFKPVLGTILRGAGAFRVRRGERDLAAIETAVALAREGEIVVMFPEGTRREKGLIKRREAKAHTGAARIALEAEVPLVPAAIKGTDRLSRLGPIRVVFGEPLGLGDLSGRDPREAAQEATDRLMEEIGRLEATL